MKRTLKSKSLVEFFFFNSYMKETDYALGNKLTDGAKMRTRLAICNFK